MDYSELSDNQKATIRKAAQMVVDAAKESEDFLTISDKDIDDLAENFWDEWISKLTGLILKQRNVGPT